MINLAINWWRLSLLSTFTLLFFSFMLAASYNVEAQCTPPTTVAHSTTSITCPSNGTITVGTASGGAGDYLEYALYNAANTTEVRPDRKSVV